MLINISDELYQYIVTYFSRFWIMDAIGGCDYFERGCEDGCKRCNNSKKKTVT